MFVIFRMCSHISIIYAWRLEECETSLDYESEDQDYKLKNLSEELLLDVYFFI